ncbi:glutamine-hydrolyzing carbamoyl-phosphate synthase small subunit, partial [Faecalibaculum rodentium]
MERLLILEDGSVYRGQGFGSDELKTGELVFNTSMTGYQEILTDNSYCGQIVMMTYPLIGNYGINRDDYESIEPAVFGFVTRDLCQSPNNWRSQETLDDFLKAHNIPGIYDVDTRAITRKLRNKGTMRAMMANPDTDIEAAVKQLQETDYLHDQVARVSSSKIFPIPNRGHKVVLMDFGAKLGIVRELSRRGCDLIVVPWDTDAQTILSYHPDGVMLSNGPGDPEDVPQAIETIRQLMGKTVIFGICLGHQLISLACGAKTYKLKFGHRGANHPVVDLETGKVDITSQNHGFAVDIDSLADTKL